MNRIPKHIAIVLAGILLLSACNDSSKKEESNTDTSEAAKNTPAVLSYQLVNIYPHDPKAFTEGLEFVNGYLYESSGEYNVSDLRKTNPITGELLQSTKVDKQYFAEGITVFKGKIYQLTYKEKTGFVYDLATMKLEKKFSFNTTEGWGMTHDSSYLIFGDGSSHLYFLDPNTLQKVKEISVTDENGPVDYVNELEYIKGYIYANRWQAEYILKIDPKDGRVVARADLSDLRAKIGIAGFPPTNQGEPDVLNGIAYDVANNRIYITGKFWPKLAEIKLDN